MKKSRLIILTAMLIVFMSVHSWSQNSTNSHHYLYVSPEGNDSNSGSIDNPLASFEGAQAKIQDFKSAHKNIPITVVFRGGKYYRTKSVYFSAKDGGTAVAPIEYKAYPEEVPVILGGKRLELEWKLHKNGIFKAKVPEGLIFESLYINDQEQILARYPNYNPEQRIFNGTAEDCISKEKVKGWKDPSGGYFHVIHKAMWGGFHYRITGKDKKGNLEMEGGWQNNRPESGLHDKLRYVENIFEELDDEKEWFLDRKKNLLYFKPEQNIDIQKTVVEVAYLENLITIKGTDQEPVAHLSIDGFHFTRTVRTFMKTKDKLLRSDWAIYRGGAILLEGTKNCSVKNSTFNQIGSNAVFFNSYNLYSKVSGCHIYDIGASAICFVGDTSAVRNPKFKPYGRPVSDEELDLTPGPKNNLYPSYCSAENNLLHDFGKVEKQVAGVQISMAAYIKVSHNSIYDCPRAGINVSEGAFGGHVIEYNDVFNTVLETSDHGSFNSWGRDRFWMAGNQATEKRVENNRATILLDILAPTIIRNNRMKCDHGWDIDLDDGSSYYHVYNNLCLKNGIKLREGYYRRVENNITLNNSLHPHVWLKNNSDVVRGNIFGTKMFPIRIDYWGFDVDKNWYMNETDLLEMKKLGVDQNGAFGNPVFMDAKNGDFSLSPDSPVFNIGWENFEMNKFGVQKESLKKIAKEPEIPEIALKEVKNSVAYDFFGGQIKNLETSGEVSATGMHEAKGVLIVKKPIFGSIVDFGIRKGDVLLKLNNEEIKDVNFLIKSEQRFDQNEVKSITVWRDQKELLLKF